MSEQLSPEDLQRPDWNSLENNYSLHDIGEAYFKGRVEQIGLDVENWGIDKRYEDENIIFDNKMDLRLWDTHSSVSEAGVEAAETNFHVLDNGNVRVLRGVADIKTKSSKSWMRKFNLRHLVHYAEWAEHYNVPVFVYFTTVDKNAEKIGEHQAVAPIEPFDYLDDYIDHYDRSTNKYIDTTAITEDCPYVKSTFGADDGNAVVEIDRNHCHSFDWVIDNVI